MLFKTAGAIKYVLIFQSRFPNIIFQDSILGEVQMDGKKFSAMKEFFLYLIFTSFSYKNQVSK
jgi:hypothetical protein